MLSASQLQKLNSPITVPEIDKVRTSLPNGKSPGPDGLPKEYYKIFFMSLSPHLSRVFNRAAATSTFPKDMLVAYVVTLPKPGKDPITQANFRPISLLNSDIKIYAKLLASRLSSTIPSLIKKDQMGFVRGRQPSDATRQILNIIHLAEVTRTPSRLLSIEGIQ